MKYIRRILFFILVLIGMAILNIGIIALLAILQELILVPSDYLLWTVNPPTYPVVFFILGLLDFYILFALGRYTKMVSNLIPEIVLEYINKNKKLLNLMVLIALYIIFPNVTSFSDTMIIHRSFYNPIGKEYLYSDVATVETGVYGESRVFSNRKGEYYYIINFHDGTRINIVSSGGEKSSDSYSMIEYIDAKLMSMDIKKVSSLENLELLSLDQYYIDRFVRIIKN